MLHGTIITYFADKKFGFIQSDNGRDIFFHISALEAAETPLEIKVGQPVKYELTPRGEVRPNGRQDGGEQRSERLSANLVVLLDKAPGGVAEEEVIQGKSPHPRARKRKPTWRR